VKYPFSDDPGEPPENYIAAIQSFGHLAIPPRQLLSYAAPARVGTVGQGVEKFVLQRAIRHKKVLLAVVIIPTVSLLLVVGAAAISRSDSASGDVNALSGGAFGENVNIHSILGITVTSGPMPTVTLPSGGGGPFQDHAVNVNVPNVLSLGVLDVSTQGAIGPNGSVTSSADLATLNLLAGVVMIDVVKSSCSASESGTSATTSLVNARAAGIGIPVDPAPNTTIAVPLVGTLILNEQLRSTGGGNSAITVNALHLKLNSPVAGTGDIILSQSRCAITTPTVTVPVGAVGGLGLAAVLGAVFFWKVTRRRPTGLSRNVVA
jgi:hypothetical protein